MQRRFQWPRSLSVPKTLLAALFGLGAPAHAEELGDLGRFAKWSTVEAAFHGPSSNGSSGSPNPFQIPVDVSFVSPSGQQFVVPAFYDGDGNGSQNGTVWKARFSPGQIGDWSFHTTSQDPLLDGHQGTFQVDPPEAGSQFFELWGRLQYAGGHYLKFANGGFWIKGGANEPEDFLAPGVMGDWNAKKAVVDYLSSQGVNSMYILLQNVFGDGDNVWPWLARTDSERFDVAKLAAWEDLFRHIQSRGIVLHLVFEDDSGWTGFDRGLYYRQMIARFGHHNGLIWNVSEEYNENYSASQVQGFAQMIRDLDPYGHPVTVHHQGGLSNWQPFLGDGRFDLTSFQTAAAPQNDAAVQWRENSLLAGRPLPISFDETGKISQSARGLSRRIAWSAYMAGAMYELFTSPLGSFQDFEGHWGDMLRARNFLESLPFWEMAPCNQLLQGGTGNRYCFCKPGEAYAVYLESGGSVQLDLSGQSGSFELQWFNPVTGQSSAGGTLQGGSAVSLGTPPFGGDAAAVVQVPVSNQRPVALIGEPEDGQNFPPGASIQFVGEDSFDPDGTIAAYYWSFGDGQASSGPNPTHSYALPGEFIATLQVEDDQGELSLPAQIQIIVSSGNVPPLANNQSLSAVESTPVSLQLSVQDPDGPGPFSYSIHSGPQSGLLQGTPPNLVYAANQGFLGLDSFTWTVNDGLADSNLATFAIDVVANLPPTANDFSLSTSMGTPLNFTFSPHVSDQDGPGPNTFAIVAPASNGDLSGSDNDWTYTPDGAFMGLDSFTWQVNDGLDDSNVATVTVQVSDLLLQDLFDRPDSPVVGNGWIETESASTVRIGGGELIFDAADDPYRPQARRSFAPQSTGVLIWEFDLDFVRDGAEGVYSFGMQVGEGAAMSEAEPWLSGAAVNLIWGGPNQGLGGHEELGYIVDGAVTPVGRISGPGRVSLRLDLDAQLYSIAAAGQLIEGIPSGHSGPVDTVRFFADEMNMAHFPSRSVDNLSIAQETVSGAPQARDDSAATDEDTPALIDVLANDSDPQGEALSIESAGPAANGSVTVEPDDSLTYLPDPNFNGSDSFSYTVRDTSGETAAAAVSVSVAAVNDAPVARDDSAAVAEDASVIIDVLANDSDVDGALVASSVSLTAAPTSGSASVDPASGTVTYLPAGGFSGTDHFSYQVCDNGNPLPARCDSALVSVNVSAVNDPPAAVDDSASTDEDTAVTIDVLANDSDPEGGLIPASLLVTAPPQHGTAAVSAGLVVYTPEPDFNGGDQFSYQICDGGSLCDSASVSLAVQAVNDAPQAQDDSAQTFVNTEAVIDVLANDSDVDGDTLAVASLGSAAGGAVSINAQGRVVYAPDAGFVGSDSFNYQVVDGQGGLDQATVQVEVLSGVIFEDSFDRPDSQAVANGWQELESVSQLALRGGEMAFDAADDAYRPLAFHSFSAQHSGVLLWSFELNFRRDGAEGTYAFWMQLGEGAAMSLNQPSASGAVVNLIWGGPNQGLKGHERLGYALDGKVTPLTRLSGRHTVNIRLDLQAGTYSVSAGGLTVEGIPVDHSGPVDTVRFFAHLLNKDHFPQRSLDDLSIAREGSP